MSDSVVHTSLPVLVSFLLILSSLEPESAELVHLSGQMVADKLEAALPFLTESELVASYAGLRRLGGGGEEGVRRFLERKFGYRLE